ncbi:metaxin-3 isoform X3 [Narcine bancroftii]|uniref:metaxin-3 isoform X3 n=1 Tax=Narcine bancroftii TaxID=1343680 RepID=UPI003831EF4F
MASPMELMCWPGDWGLPSIHTDSLIVLAYAKFSRAPLKVYFINNPWKTPTGEIPVLISNNMNVVQPDNILNFLRKQKYNADYELTAKQGADTLAFIALIEEKLRPALIYRDAKECLNLLSSRLGTSNFFFEKTPTSFDAFAFGFLAPLYKAELPNAHLQKHLHQLHNLCHFCDNILTQYFVQSSVEEMVDENLQKLTQLVNKECTLIEKMDDNLRNSPQHKSQGATPLKLTTMTSEANSSQH